MRAMKDLVCGSSACPDDIDATNAWNPTDIHVRVYAAENSFSRAVAYRMTPDAEPRLTRESGFHPRMSELTRNFTEYRGFWLPNRFNNTGPVAEYWACREKAAVMDLSPLRKFEVLGCRCRRPAAGRLHPQHPQALRRPGGFTPPCAMTMAACSTMRRCFA